MTDDPARHPAATRRSAIRSARPKGQRAIVSICADGGLGSVLLLEAA